MSPAHYLPPCRLVPPCPQSVFLSKNSLTSLQGIQQFRAARTVSLADNLLASLDDLAPLALGCPSLENLSLEGNPLSMLPNYRCVCRAQSASPAQL